MKIKRTKRIWTIIEDEWLITNYYKTDKLEIISKLKRSWDAIKLRAAKLGLKRWAGFFRNSDVSKLLKDDILSYYWIGFLLADGHIHDNRRLALTLGIKDKDHLLKFSQFIICPNIYEDLTKCWIKAQDIEFIPLISSKFDIKHNKTIYPPDFNQYNISEYLKAVLLIWIHH